MNHRDPFYEPGYDPEACEEPGERLCTHCGFSVGEDNPADLCVVCLEDSDDGYGDPDRGVCFEPDREMPGEESPPKEEW